MLRRRGIEYLGNPKIYFKCISPFLITSKMLNQVLHPMFSQNEIFQVIAHVKMAILKDMVSGLLPTDINSLEDVKAHVDLARYEGWMKGPVDANAVLTVREAIDEWIHAGIPIPMLAKRPTLKPVLGHDPIGNQLRFGFKVEDQFITESNFHLFCEQGHGQQTSTEISQSDIDQITTLNRILNETVDSTIESIRRSVAKNIGSSGNDSSTLFFLDPFNRTSISNVIAKFMNFEIYR
jgi:hypothetical protein